MNIQELFDRLKSDSEKYCLIVGWVDLHKDEDEPGRFYMENSIEENEYIVKVGSFPHDFIRDAIGEHDWKVDREGMYEFWCLLSFHGPRRPCDPEDESYLSIEHVETLFHISFEDRESQMNHNNDLPLLP